MNTHTSKRRQRNATTGDDSNGGRSNRRISSWLRNNWTESETREVMEILVDEFITASYTTAAYSKNHSVPDARFQHLSFSRPSKELYNKVQNLRQRFFTPHSYLLRWANPAIDSRNLKRAEKCLMNLKTRESIHGIFSGEVPEAMHMLAAVAKQGQRQEKAADKKLASAAAATEEAVAASSSVADGYAVDDCVDDSDYLAPGSHHSTRRPRSSSNNSNAGEDGDQQPVVKSVNYYCDIFRRKAPELWVTSVNAYRLFLANKELQRTNIDEHPDNAAAGASHMEARVHRQSLQTPSSSLLTDFQSDITSDATDDYATSSSSRCMSAMGGRSYHRPTRQLVAAVGHSWHKFLGLRSRWTSLGLRYAGKDDWVRQEATFLAQHLLSVLEPGALNTDDSNSTIPLTVVPHFRAALDAGGIKMAVSRSHIARTVRASALAGDLAICIRDAVEHREPYTMVTVCALLDHTPTGSHMSLALLVSHGSNDQPFGAFPHHDPVLSHLVSSTEGPLWHEYTDRKHPADAIDPLTPPPPPHLLNHNSDAPAPGLAFAYVQGGLRYSFFSRRRGHFFELTCADWTPTIVGTGLRPAWQPSAAAGPATVLMLMRADKEKVLASMVELFGLRPFAHGFFDPVLAASTAPVPASVRRVSDDPRLHGPVRRRHGPAQSVVGGGVSSGKASIRRARINNGSPYGAPPLLSPDSAASSSSSVAGAGATNSSTMQFLSPQMSNIRGAQSLDFSSMSLPNSPFAGITLDHAPMVLGNGTGGGYQPPPADAVPAVSLFPPLNDAALLAAGDQHHAAMAAAAAAAAAIAGASPSIANSVSIGGGSTPAMAPASMESLASVTPLAAASGFFDEPAAIQTNVYPAMFSGGANSTSSSALSAIHDLHNSPYANSSGALPLDHHMTTATSPAFWDMAGIALPTANSSGQMAFATPVTEEASAAMAAAVAAEMAMDIVNRVTINGAQNSTVVQAEQRMAPSVAVYPPQPPQLSPWDDAASQQPLQNVFGSTEMLMRLAQPSPLQTNYTPTATRPASIADPCSGIQPMDVSAMPQVIPTPASTTASNSAASGMLGIVDGPVSVSSIAAYFGTPSLASAVFMDDPNTTGSSSNASYQFDVEIPTTGC
ncbi:hypothetical protein IW140_002109 [Coemansia sp. RSA 1813]|nr:hypothetical protein LPJ74_001326 [Coemansia sp. RSA 1843]KAJ2213871.1 hypothetical protein EV179_003455 [Coemansia sp. RSA 487]KAJ2570683.1 hypothetical protein IW140_002109 [Coemansia sp. RSA 1813]